jgi:hypothetical protein
MRPDDTQAAALLVERDLTGTIEMLRRYRKDEHLKRAIAEIAHAEAYEEDPIRSRPALGPGFESSSNQ